MADFLLLGQIPGTSIQISFSMWLAALSTLVAVYIIWQIFIASKRLWIARLYVSLLRSRTLARRLYPAEL
jgi:hypothetical protein